MHNPDALIVLSVRDSAEQWWDSWSNTIAVAAAREPPPGRLFAEYAEMAADLLRTRLGVANPSGDFGRDVLADHYATTSH